MRLAFCFISNDIKKFLEMKKSFHYCLDDISYSCVNSFTINVLINPPFPYIQFLEGWNIQRKNYHFRDPIDMFTMRQDSLDMARNTDIIFIGDDDFEFLKGSTAVINQCCVYMQKNPDCGAIYLGGNFGGEGSYRENEIYIANKGHLGTNRGILVRNRDYPLLDNRLQATGANFDAALGFTALIQGLYVARRLHTPIEHHTKKVMKKDHLESFYDLNYLKAHGIMNKVNKVIGKWDDHAIWPETIFKKYRNTSMARGFIPKYEADGTIIGEENAETFFQADPR